MLMDYYKKRILTAYIILFVLLILYKLFIFGETLQVNSPQSVYTLCFIGIFITLTVIPISVKVKKLPYKYRLIIQFSCAVFNVVIYAMTSETCCLLCAFIALCLSLVQKTYTRK